MQVFWDSVDSRFSKFKGKIDERKYSTKVDQISLVIWKLMIASSPIILWSKINIPFDYHFHQLSNSAAVSESLRELCYSELAEKPRVTAYLTPTVFFSSDGQVANKATVLVCENSS